MHINMHKDQSFATNKQYLKTQGIAAGILGGNTVYSTDSITARYSEAMVPYYRSLDTIFCFSVG